MTAEIAELEKFRLAIVDLLYDSEEEEDGVGEEMDFGEDKLMSVSSSSSKPKSKKQMTMLYSSANRRRALTNNKADEIYALERATQIVNAQRKSKVSSRSSRHTFLVEHESDVDMLKGVQNEDGGGVKRSRQMTAMQEAEELRRRLFLYMEKLFR